MSKCQQLGDLGRTYLPNLAPFDSTYTPNLALLDPVSGSLQSLRIPPRPDPETRSLRSLQIPPIVSSIFLRISPLTLLDSTFVWRFLLRRTRLPPNFSESLRMPLRDPISSPSNFFSENFSAPEVLVFSISGTRNPAASEDSTVAGGISLRSGSARLRGGRVGLHREEWARFQKKKKKKKKTAKPPTYMLKGPRTC